VATFNVPELSVFAPTLPGALGIPFAIAAIGGLTLLSGIIAATVMRETLPEKKST
jgi:hypothetical protein